MLLGQLSRRGLHCWCGPLDAITGPGRRSGTRIPLRLRMLILIGFDERYQALDSSSPLIHFVSCRWQVEQKLASRHCFRCRIRCSEQGRPRCRPAPGGNKRGVATFSTQCATRWVGLPWGRPSPQVRGSARRPALIWVRRVSSSRSGDGRRRGVAARFGVCAAMTSMATRTAGRQ